MTDATRLRQILYPDGIIDDQDGSSSSAGFQPSRRGRFCVERFMGDYTEDAGQDQNGASEPCGETHKWRRMTEGWMKRNQSRQYDWAGHRR